MKHLDLVQTYLADTNVFKVKLQNMHWNVKGKRFLILHNLTEEIYQILWDQIDVVAETLKMKEVLPLSTMKEWLEAATLEEMPAKDFTCEEVLDTLVADLEAMKELVVKVRNAADEAGDFEVVALFEDYAGVYSKYIWFAKSLNA